MLEISSDILENWLNGETSNSDPFFVMVKTPTCGKCSALLQNKNIFRNEEWFRIFNFKPTDIKGAEILQKIGVTSVPFFIFRYKQQRKNFWKYFHGIIMMDNPEALMEGENLLDAIYDKDYVFFDYNEKTGEVPEENQLFISLLDEIYGPPDEETIKNRKVLSESITN